MNDILDKLRLDVQATAVLVLDDLGTPLAFSGDARSIDMNALSHLVAANASTVSSVGKLIADKGFSILCEREDLGNVHISVVRGVYLLVVSFRERNNLARVRQFAKQAGSELESLLEPAGDDGSSGGSTPGSQATPVLGARKR